MKITVHEVERITIEQFADRHGLEMEVHERDLRRYKRDLDSRYYAHFKSADVKNGSVLEGVYGNGATPKAAIADYAARLSEHTGRYLVNGAASPCRSQYLIPYLTA